MRKRVPLNAIRAFEATARNGSVAKAADELCVTPTAVSHQIRLLEEFLDTKLFIRKNSRIELTPESSATVADITHALDLINEAVLALQPNAEIRSKLSVSASASVASLWLMPRLSEFFSLAPDVDVAVRAFISRREGETNEADLRICNWRSNLDMQIEPLLEEEITPVATPELAARYDGNAREILAHAPLIHVDRTQDGLEGTYPDSARSGIGVILGRSILIERALERGELVPVAEPYPIRSPYYLLSPWKVGRDNVIERFKDWLFDKVSASSRLTAA